MEAHKITTTAFLEVAIIQTNLDKTFRPERGMKRLQKRWHLVAGRLSSTESNQVTEFRTYEDKLKDLSIFIKLSYFHKSHL